jgi:hypothetical protein
MAHSPTTSGSHGSATVTGSSSAPRTAAAPTVDPAAAAALREAQAASSIGAQVILDFNGDGSLGARGGVGATIEENTMIRDAHLIAVGLDPTNPSGPPTGEPWVPPAPVTAGVRHSVSGHATRMSSLAAGIIAEPDDVPTPPAGSVTGAAR